MPQKQSNDRTFQIEVENQFDNEKRTITVVHRKREGSDEVDIDFHDKFQKERHFKPYFPQKTFQLSTGDILDIRIGKRQCKCSEGEEPKYWYIKLPFVADFSFIWDDEKQKPAHYEIARDAHSGSRTMIYVSMTVEPVTFKLLVGPPGRLEENYQPKHLRHILQNDGGGSPDDNVTLGDNGDG